MPTEKIPVAILGATGMVGQRFVQLLENHPLFRVAALASSERSAGKHYADAVHWILERGIPEGTGGIRLLGPEDPLPCRWVFSALPGSAAGPVEERLARSGHVVCSNASAHRTDRIVPLLIPEVNADHLDLLSAQRAACGRDGVIVTTPNCTTTILTLALCPLHREFTLKSVHAVSLQGLSGAGYPGVSSLDVIDNVLPHIDGEEEKLITEPGKLLGICTGEGIEEARFAMSGQCNRVPVREGHVVCVNAAFERRPSVEDVIGTLESFEAPEVRGLPGAPRRPVRVTADPDRPQPRLDRLAGGGMAVTVGRVRDSKTLHVQFVVIGHNTLRGAAGGTLLNGELLLSRADELLCASD
jgi:aspartate-semialdehyde dehydrogenase